MEFEERVRQTKSGDDGKDSEDGVINQPEQTILGVPLSEFIRQRLHKPRGRSTFEG